jgi:hypothetical protein
MNVLRPFLLRAFVLGGAVAVLAGCAGTERPEVDRVATDFATGGPAARCALLAPAALTALESAQSAPCAEAVGRLAPSGGQVQRTEVWGDEAQVRLTDDTLFLTRTSAGWKVVAAGCASNGDLPYKCRVEGP